MLSLVFVKTEEEKRRLRPKRKSLTVLKMHVSTLSTEVTETELPNCYAGAPSGYTWLLPTWPSLLEAWPLQYSCGSKREREKRSYRRGEIQREREAQC